MNEQDTAKGNRSQELCRRVVTTESFIAEAKEIYGDRYDYNKVDYKNRDHRVVVTCPVHGDFQVYAREHLDGKGCPKCEKGEKFIAKLKEKFGERFGLGEFVYESSTSPVTLICPTHGAFSKLPHAILYSKCGCPECGNELMRQLQEQAHEEAVRRKEEARQRQIEAERKAKEEAQYYWGKKIQNILSSDTYSNEYWDTDFFGFDLHHICMDNGEPINGRMNIPLNYSHYPFRYADVEADNGNLVKLSLYLSGYYDSDVDDKLLAEILLVGESIISNGQAVSYEVVKEKYGIYDYSIYKYDNIVDGYKVQVIKRNGSVELKVRKIGARALRRINYSKYDAKSLPKSFVGIDFETLYPQRVSACSVGMVKYIDGEIVDRFYTLIRPPLDYPGKCGSVLTWIHGLTEEMVKDARTFKEILPQMESFVDGLPLVAHNACVERACIRDASAFYGVETKLDFENIYDTLPLSRQAEAKLGISEEGPGTHQLDTVCKRFGIAGNNHHNALADAEMSGNLMVLFQKILSEGETVEVSETPTTPKQKYNPEDKVQRTDLESVVENPFKNQVVVLTGFAKSDSQEYAHKLNKLGAIIKDGVNKKTNILITGYNAGPSKMQKAQEVGARIISEEEFKEIIKQIKEQFYE
jgi:DNA polymerase-3 subunit epsilon